jgi:hypothetical protein
MTRRIDVTTPRDIRSRVTEERDRLRAQPFGGPRYAAAVLDGLLAWLEETIWPGPPGPRDALELDDDHKIHIDTRPIIEAATTTPIDRDLMRPAPGSEGPGCGPGPSPNPEADRNVTPLIGSPAWESALRQDGVWVTPAPASRAQAERAYQAAAGFVRDQPRRPVNLTLAQARPPRPTAEEFERQYARRSGITVERLRELGRTVRPCHCDDTGCEGWQSISTERAMELDAERLAAQAMAATAAAEIAAIETASYHEAGRQIDVTAAARRALAKARLPLEDGPRPAPAELTDLRKLAAWIPVALEMKADMGLPLTDEERAELERRQQAIEAWHNSWRGRRARARAELAAAAHRIRHAIAQAIDAHPEREDHDE